MTDKSRALVLADDLDAEFVQGRISNHSGRKAAVMLRHLHAENEALRCQKLQAVADQADQMDADEALLRQALGALQQIDDAMPFPVAKQTIAAIKERLK